MTSFKLPRNAVVTSKAKFLVLSFTQLCTVFDYTSPSSLSVHQFPFVEFHWFAFQNNLATKKQDFFVPSPKCMFCSVMYALFCIFCSHRANWHSTATLPEVFLCFFLSCKANARVYLAQRGHVPHSSKLVTSVVLCIVFIDCVVIFIFCL